MSRTTRTLPRWIQQQITSTNNLVNGYRGLQYGYRASCHDCIPTLDMNGMTSTKKSWRKNRNDIAYNEHTTILYSTDNGRRNLRNCKNSLPIGKACGWNMSDATGNIAKKTLRKQWARAGRRWSVFVVREEMSMMELDEYDRPLGYNYGEAEAEVEGDYTYNYRHSGLECIAYNRGYSDGYSDGYDAATRALQHSLQIA